MANSFKEIDRIKRREYSIKEYQEESKNSGRCFILRKDQNQEILKKEKIPLSALINYYPEEIRSLKDLNGLICHNYEFQDDNYLDYLDQEKFSHPEDYFFGFTFEANLKNSRISGDLAINACSSGTYYEQIYLEDAQINKLTFIGSALEIYILNDTKIKTLEINNPKSAINFNNANLPINEIIEEIILNGKHYIKNTDSNEEIKEHSGRITTTSLIESGLYIPSNLSSNIEVGNSVKITNSQGTQTNFL